jgi:hypothetical protein
MGNQNSGRRRVKPPAKDLELPAMGDSEDSIGAYCEAVNTAVASRKLDPRTADTLHAGARAKLASLRQKHTRNELNDLYALLAEARAINQAGLARAAAERVHAEVGTSEGHCGDPAPPPGR